jgi:DNA-binding SARP family transcriptional activator
VIFGDALLLLFELADREDERFQGRIAMEAETALGLREAVAERYERLRTLLDERLGLEPAQETRLLHRRLLAQT